MENSYTFVVVGGGISGVSCTEALRTWTEDKSTLLISSSSIIKMATNAVSIGKTLVQFDVGEISAEDLAKRADTLDVLIDAVKSINSETKLVTTTSGRNIHYECLCLCTGGHPKLILEDNPYVIGIRDTDSVNNLKHRLSGSKRIIIAGNGGIASELVYEVQGVEKIWVIKDNHISSVFLDPGAATFVKEYLQKKDDPEEKVTKRLRYTGESSKASLGPDWLANTTLQGVGEKENLKIIFESCVRNVEILPEGSEFPIRVELDSGEKFEADLVISATGVIPNGGEVEVIPLRLSKSRDHGIVVDESMMTSVKDIYAAGDVVTAGWAAAPHWFQMRLWTQARQMGLHAGKCMAAALTNEVVYQDFCFEVFTHVTRFFGLKVILIGLFNAQKLEGDCEYLLRVTPRLEYIKLVMQRGKVQGAVLIGETDLEEMCENLILDQIDVSSLGEHLLDPDVDVDDYFD